jgi:hypothetical protein
MSCGSKIKSNDLKVEERLTGNGEVVEGGREGESDIMLGRVDLNKVQHTNIWKGHRETINLYS